MGRAVNDTGDARRRIAAVHVVLDAPQIRELIGPYPRPLVLEAVRGVLERLRRELLPESTPPDMDEIAGLVREAIFETERERLRPVVNATGIILHTGLGRAVLPRAAVDALAGLDRCCNLQIDLDTGRRGRRNDRTEQLLCRLTGAEAAVIVNNNAAATLLILAALCAGKEVIVSRGQLIEIGGSYRLPDCVHQSGAILVETGTTNKTHLRDYEAAITDRTGAILRVNPSNYRIIGFAGQVDLRDLAALKRKHGLFLIDDLGCGALVDLRTYGLPYEPTVPESIDAGADLCCFSGDKLLGGPQAGIIVGKKDLVDRIRKHPLTRMLRVCKLTDMALEHTLRLFLDPQRLLDTHPTLRMIAEPAERVQARAEEMCAAVAGVALDVAAVPMSSATGGGSLPGVDIPSWGLRVRRPNRTADTLARALRLNEPPVIGRVQEDAVYLDARTILEDEGVLVVEALRRVAAQV